MRSRVVLVLALLTSIVAVPVTAASAQTGEQPRFDFDHSIPVAASSATFTGNGLQIVIQTVTGDLIVHRLSDGDQTVLEGANPTTQLSAVSTDMWGSRVIFSDATATKVWLPEEGRVETVGPPHTEVGVGSFDDSTGYWVWDGEGFDLIDKWDGTRTEVDIPFIPLTIGGMSMVFDIESTTSFTATSLFDFETITSTQACEWGRVSCDIFLAQHLGWTARAETKDDVSTHRFAYLLLNQHLYSERYVMDVQNDRIDIFKRILVWTGRAEYTTTLDQLLRSWDYSGEDARIARLYQAFFGRSPDLGGLHYWLNLHHNGQSTTDLTFWFSQSDEFKNAYDGTSDAEYLDRVYQNVLGRQYDQAGYDYWLELLSSGELDRAGVVYWITANAEFINNYPYLP